MVAQFRRIVSLLEHVGENEYGEQVIYVRASGPRAKIGEVVVKVDRSRSEAEIEGLIVAKDFRGNGFGAELVRYAEGVAKRYGVGRIALRPVPIGGSDPGRLRNWYRGLGYELNKGLMVKTTLA